MCDSHHFSANSALILHRTDSDAIIFAKTHVFCNDTAYFAVSSVFCKVKIVAFAAVSAGGAGVYPAICTNVIYSIRKF